jgi:hypothetical protein
MKKSLFSVLIVGSTMVIPSSLAVGQSSLVAPQPALKSSLASADIPGVPPLPHGKSTILGGRIRAIDPVRDELSLKIAGQRPVKILFDERTQVFRDGKKIPLRDLGVVDHASVQTILDGTDIYALSIHILSQAPEGDYEGKVLSYNPANGELTMSSVLFREPIKLQVPSGTPVTRVGQPTFTAGQQGTGDLVNGALISATFRSNNQERGVATGISVLALPGSSFVFIGNISALDLHSGTLVVIDPRDSKSYRLSFDANSLSTSHNLHVGDHVIVSAEFEGSRYVASTVTIDN